MRKIPGCIWMTALTLVTVIPVSADDSELSTMIAPEYTEDGDLIRPKGYREWVFVGASLGLDYSSEEAPDGPGRFHHVYIQPEAYRHFIRTGEFPDKAILMMENYSAGSKEENTADVQKRGKEPFENFNGHFEHERVGLEAAVKDSDHDPELKWSYYFFSMGNQLRESARAFPKRTCWDCHNAHAAHDNVFLQFYPILREPLDALQTRPAETD